MSVFQRLRQGYCAARRWVPLTDLGILILGLGAAVLAWYGLPRSDYVVQLAGAAAIGLVGVGLGSVFVAYAVVRRRVASMDEGTGETIRFEAQRGYTRGRRVPRLRWLPLVDIELGVHHPEGLLLTAEGGREKFEAQHRTGADRLVRSFRVEDAFGLAAVSFREVGARSVEVAPHLGALERSAALIAMAPGESRADPRGRPAGDRVEHRPYVRGDPLRLVLWKVYARTGELAVRSAERALDEETEVHAYLVSAYGDEPPAAAAWVALDRGLLGPRWRFGTDLAPVGTDDVDAAKTLVARSREGRGAGRGLDAFLSALKAKETARLLLFVPGQPGSWLQEVSDRVSGLAARTVAVVVFDGDAGPEKGGWFVHSGQDAATREARPTEAGLDEVVNSLRSAGMEVVLLDRITGRSVGGHLARRVA